MIGALLLMGLIQTAQPNTLVRTRQSIELPDEIAPAVVPYLQCVLVDETQRVIGSETGDEARAGIQLLLSDCRQAREEAAVRAREMLRSSRVPPAKRDGMIDETLSSIDHSLDNLADHLDRVNERRRATEGRNDASN